MQRYIWILYFVPLFVLTFVHELGHAIAALLLGARVHSIRVLGFEARIVGRRRAWWRKSISIRHRRYRTHHYGQVAVTFRHQPPSSTANLFFSSAGYLVEWAVLGWCWTIIHSRPDHRSWSLAVFVFMLMVSSFKSVESALSDAKGDDLYEVRRSLRAIARRTQRA